MKKILILTNGSWNHASSRIRAFQYIPYFEKEMGLHVTRIARVADVKEQNLAFFLLKRILLMKRWLAILFSSYQYIYIQRVFLQEWELKMLKKKQAKIIYDVDDPIFLDGGEDPYSTMLKYADLLVVSTDELATHAEKKGITAQIITTPVEHIDLAAFSSHSEKADIINIGWLGAPATTVHLQAVEAALQQLSKRYAIRLLLMGAIKSYHPEGIEIVYETWALTAEVAFIDRIQIGIMPLIVHPWSAYKGGYKLLQYMSYAKPVVTTPVGINGRIVQDGVNGFHANTDAEWEKALEKLINSVDLRKQMGQKGYEIVQKEYVREVCFEKLKTLILQLN